MPCPTARLSADKHSRWRSLRMVIRFSALPQIRTDPNSMYHITNTTFTIIQVIWGNQMETAIACPKQTGHAFHLFVYAMESCFSDIINFRLNSCKPLKNIVPGICNGFVIRTNMREVFLSYYHGPLAITETNYTMRPAYIYIYIYICIYVYIYMNSHMSDMLLVNCYNRASNY